MGGANTIYLFDVDGTLTPPRQAIVPEFALFFQKFAETYPVYLITGSDMPKIKSQLPQPILKACKGLYVCSAAEFWQNNHCIEKRPHEFPASMMQLVQHAIDQSPYPLRAGHHIEPRTGMVNVSIVGRNATPEQRLAYYQWDHIACERMGLAEKLATEFPDYEVSIGGQISIDIMPKGLNKSIAMDRLLTHHGDAPFCFFGDRMADGGNDKPLADALIDAGPPHRAIEVIDYHATWDNLKQEIAQNDPASLGALTR